MREVVTFKKECMKDKFFLEFTFVGRKKDENIDVEKLSELLDRCLVKIYGVKDIKTIILWIRTILRDIEEQNLRIIITEKKQITDIFYENKKLTLFHTSELLKDIKLDVLYKDTLNFKFSAFDRKVATNKTLREYERLIRSAMGEIFLLEKYSIRKKLYPEEIKICDNYKLFYNENPDFSKEDISAKIQDMCYILKHFGECNDYNFDKAYLEINRPVCLSLEMQIYHLIPFGEIKVNESEMKVSDGYKNKIKTIGEMVEKFTENNLNNLDKLCILLYENEILERYNYFDLDKLAKKTRFTKEEVEENIALVKKIRKKFE